MSTGDTRLMLAQQIRICRDDNLSDEQSADNIMHFFDVKYSPFYGTQSAMTDKRAVTKIGLIRARNNGLWMKLMEIALETAPDETKEVLRQINANDREISSLLTELAK